MKIRLLSALAGLAIGLVLPTVAQQKTAFDPKQQIRVLAKTHDEAVNKHDAAAVAALYTQDGVLTTYDHGSFRGRKDIENVYARWYFKRQFSNYFTTVNRVTAVGNQIRSTGTWSATPQNVNGGPAKDVGHYSWVVVREGDTWKISIATYDKTNRNH
jgi:uncharacterized protein (TIGR02246 family)